MKRQKIFVGIVLIAAVLLTGCGNGTTDGPSKTTSIDEIALIARYYENPPVPNWTNGWESAWQDVGLKLTNVLPGAIKNNTVYEVTIKGTLDILDITTTLPSPDDIIENPATQMTGFQFVFTVPQIDWMAAWLDLSTVPKMITINEGPFSVTRTITTRGNAIQNFDASRATLALTNATTTVEAVNSSNASPAATLTNVTITITEK